jgi:probable rRNA maturation factor
MVDVEVVGETPRLLPPAEIERLAGLAAASAGLDDGHLAVQFVDAAEIAALNLEHRGKAQPTDVLAFPIDGDAIATAGPRELGDVVICVEYSSDLRAAVVHGVLHLVGMDHEVDAGEMLAVQDELLSW